MPIRVVQVATGNAGRIALSQLIEDPRFAAGRPVLVVDHTTRLRPDLRPDWPQPAQDGGSYRVEITGVGRAVNAIPDVVAAAPGIRTTLDLPFGTAKGIFATTIDHAG